MCAAPAESFLRVVLHAGVCASLTLIEVRVVLPVLVTVIVKWAVAKVTTVFFVPSALRRDADLRRQCLQLGGLVDLDPWMGRRHERCDLDVSVTRPGDLSSGRRLPARRRDVRERGGHTRARARVGLDRARVHGAERAGAVRRERVVDHDAGEGHVPRVGHGNREAPAVPPFPIDCVAGLLRLI